MPDRPNIDPQIRKTVSLPMSLWNRIEDWQLGARIKRDSEALRVLIRRGLHVVLRNQARKE